MSKRILLEDCCGEFIVDRQKIVEEKSPSGIVSKIIPGKFSICDTVNGNNRIYPRKVWEKNLVEGSDLMNRIKKIGAWGLLEHPEDGRIDLRSPIAIRLIEVQLQSDGTVTGKIKILDTDEGRKLQVMVDEGYNPLVSSRGFGTVTKRSDGIDEVQEDYVCEGWDVVIQPSFTACELTPQRAATKESKIHPDNWEGAPPVAENLKVSNPSASQVTPAKARIDKPKTNIAMDLKNIQERLSTLRGTPISGLTPERFAEGRSVMQELHREASSYLSENATASWDVSQLHSQISDLEKNWAEAVSAPSKKASKLVEDNAKLLKVAATVAKTGLAYKDELTETRKKLAEAQNLVKEVAARGRAWKARAESLKGKLDYQKEALWLSSSGNDELAAMYKTDLTEAGKHILTLEFKEKVEAEPIKKLMTEATHPNHIQKIRETLETETKVASPAAEVKKEEEKPAAKQESKESPKAPAEAPKVEAASIPTQPAVQLGITSISESLAITRRLSKAAVSANK